VRFLRQLAAAAAIVTAVVLIGLAWEHVAPGSLGGSGGRQVTIRGRVVKGLPASAQPPPGAKPPSGTELTRGGPSSIPSLQLGDLLEPVNLAVLWNTAWIEAAVIAAVVIVDAGLRKWRRASRPSR